MKIALAGYGKMGHMIEAAAKLRGHDVVATIDISAPDASVRVSSAAELADVVEKCGADGVIEFTHPTSVLENIRALVPMGIPVVVGTTGWMDKLDEVISLVKSSNGSLFYSSNYSIGVNMFYRMVKNAATLMAQYEEYDVAVWEAHHRQKADSPSGTALDIAKLIMEANPGKNEMIFDAFHERPQNNQLHVSSTRIGSVPGTHTVYFDSAVDSIELTHTARNREGLAMGSVRAMEWLLSGLEGGSLTRGQTYNMDNMLSK